MRPTELLTLYLYEYDRQLDKYAQMEQLQVAYEIPNKNTYLSDTIMGRIKKLQRLIRISSQHLQELDRQILNINNKSMVENMTVDNFKRLNS